MLQTSEPPSTAYWTPPTWHTGPDFPRQEHAYAPTARDRMALVARVAEAFRALPPTADVAVLVDLARRLLNPAWGTGLPGEPAVSDAVEQLRVAALHRPRLVRECRAIVKGAREKV